MKAQCIKCIHYHTTWDKHLPRGCKLFNIKTHLMPSVVIKKETGQECSGFTLRSAQDKMKKEEEDKKYK
jgi:hypothetical protein